MLLISAGVYPNLHMLSCTSSIHTIDTSCTCMCFVCLSISLRLRVLEGECRHRGTFTHAKELIIERRGKRETERER